MKCWKKIDWITYAISKLMARTKKGNSGQDLSFLVQACTISIMNRRSDSDRSAIKSWINNDWSVQRFVDFDSSSATGIPKVSAILSSRCRDGKWLPRSNLETVTVSAPNRSANSAWVSPKVFLRSAMFLPSNVPRDVDLFFTVFAPRLLTRR